MDSSDSVGVYGEAKAEYTRQLCSYLVPALEGYFLDLLSETKQKTGKNDMSVYRIYQDSLKEFPDWNVDKVQRETEKIVTSTKCDYLEEILTAVFIAHTKVLSAIRLTNRNKKLQITIPKLEHFLHRTMTECARLLWSNTYLLIESGSSPERQRNLRQVEQLLQEGVLQSIRSMLPVKSILKEYLVDEGAVAEDDANETSEAAQVSEEDKAEEEETKVEETKAEETKVEEREEVQEKEEKEVAEVAEKEVTAPPPSPATTPVISTVEVRVDLSGNEIKDQTKPPTIDIDTEPSVSFTKFNTVFHYDPEKNVEANVEEKLEFDPYADGIVIDESTPAEPLDDFEEIEKGDELEIAENEFETL